MHTFSQLDGAFGPFRFVHEVKRVAHNGVRAGTSRRDDGVIVFFESDDVVLNPSHGFFDVAAIQSRLTTAGLATGVVHTATELFEQEYRTASGVRLNGVTDTGREEIHVHHGFISSVFQN